MPKFYLQNAPRGVTAIQLDNGDEAIFLDGESIACCDLAERDDPVVEMGQLLARSMGVPFRLLSLPVPGDEEWSWNDVTDALNWGARVILPRMMLRSVLECSTSHITEGDNELFESLGSDHEDSGWILNSGIGHLLRLNAVYDPLIRLKRLGISRTTRALIARAIRKADISMIHFSSVGEEIEGAPTFNW